MDLLKQAFLNIKQDIESLKQQISFLSQELQDISAQARLLNSFIQDTQNLLNLLKNQQKITQKALKEHISAHKADFPAIQHITPAYPAHEQPLQPPQSQNMPISTGNEGVPSVSQSNSQSDKYATFTPQKTPKYEENQQKYDETPENLLKIASGAYLQPKSTSQQPSQPQDFPSINQLEKASEILDNLDSLKKEVRRKFKALTLQEFKVFAAIYQLENQGNQVNYPLLSKKLNLTTSSIRDYISRITKKGIPILKEKINNKQIILHISADLKKIASLPTILQLREL